MGINFTVCPLDRLAGKSEMDDFYACLGICDICAFYCQIMRYIKHDLLVYLMVWIFSSRHASFSDSIVCLLEISLKFDFFWCIKKYKEMIQKDDGSYGLSRNSAMTDFLGTICAFTFLYCINCTMSWKELYFLNGLYHLIQELYTRCFVGTIYCAWYCTG